MSFPLRPLAFGRLTVLAVLVASPVVAKEHRVSYAEEMKSLLMLTEPQFDRLQGLVLLSETGTRRACPGASIRLVDGEQVRPLPMDASGRVGVPIEQALAERGAELLLRKPDDAPPCQLFLNMTGKVPAGLGMALP